MEARGRGGGGGESAHLSEIKGVNKRSDRERTAGRDGHGERGRTEGLQRIDPEQSKRKQLPANVCLGRVRPFPGLVSASSESLLDNKDDGWSLLLPGGGGAGQIRLQHREQLREGAQLKSVPMAAEAPTLLNQS